MSTQPLLPRYTAPVQPARRVLPDARKALGLQGRAEIAGNIADAAETAQRGAANIQQIRAEREERLERARATEAARQAKMLATGAFNGFTDAADRSLYGPDGALAQRGNIQGIADQTLDGMESVATKIREELPDSAHAEFDENVQKYLNRQRVALLKHEQKELEAHTAAVSDAKVSKSHSRGVARALDQMREAPEGSTFSRVQAMTDTLAEAVAIRDEIVTEAARRGLNYEQTLGELRAKLGGYHEDVIRALHGNGFEAEARVYYEGMRDITIDGQVHHVIAGEERTGILDMFREGQKNREVDRDAARFYNANPGSGPGWLAEAERWVTATYPDDPEHATDVLGAIVDRGNFRQKIEDEAESKRRSTLTVLIQDALQENPAMSAADARNIAASLGGADPELAEHAIETWRAYRGDRRAQSREKELRWLDSLPYGALRGKDLNVLERDVGIYLNQYDLDRLKDRHGIDNAEMKVNYTTADAELLRVAQALDLVSATGKPKKHREDDYAAMRDLFVHLTKTRALARDAKQTSDDDAVAAADQIIAESQRRTGFFGKSATHPYLERYEARAEELEEAGMNVAPAQVLARQELIERKEVERSIAFDYANYGIPADQAIEDFEEMSAAGLSPERARLMARNASAFLADVISDPGDIGEIDTTRVREVYPLLVRAFAEYDLNRVPRVEASEFYRRASEILTPAEPDNE